MDDEQKEQQPTEMPTARSTANPRKTHQLKKMLAWILVLLLVASTLGFAFLWYKADQKVTDAQKQKTNLQKQVDALKKELASTKKTPAKEDTDSPCSDTASDSMKANIKAALDTENTAVFSTYTTNPVKYVLAASEYGGDISAAEAATALQYTHGATGPWDFNLPAATIDGYDAGFYTDYFSNKSYVGRAASGMVVSFEFNCDGKIKQIFVAADEDIL